MATDAVAVAAALVTGIVAVRSRAGGSNTFGLFRLEVLVALGNAVLLIGVAGFVVISAVARISGESPEILSGPMLVVALGGLAVNVVGLVVLRRDAAQSLNVEGAYVEVLGDLIASIGVVGAAVVVAITGWAVVDAVVGVLIGVLIAPRAIRLAAKALRVLAERAPDGLDVAAVRRDLSTVPGVVGVHDLHVWSVSSGMETAAVHLVVAEGTPLHPVLDDAREVLRCEHGIEHATVQIEPDSHRGCDELGW